MAEEQFQERTEQATPKRLAEAREKGQIPRSRELSTMAVLFASALAFLFFGDYLVADFSTLMGQLFTLSRSEIYDASTLAISLSGAMSSALVTLAPFFIVVFMIAVFSPLLVGGWSFSTSALSFKFSKLDPVKGLGRIFSLKGLIELVKALAKFMVVLLVAIAMLYVDGNEYLNLGTYPVISSIKGAGSLMAVSFLILSASLIIIAVIDVPFQMWDYQKQLRMTRQEIKDEMKQTEGIPEVRRKIREKQRELAERRMMEEVPKADVVITNPTHYAIAIKYDDARMAAPVVVARGRDLVASQIRSIARSSNVPLVSSPPLARAIYFSTDINEEIPAGLFLAVARVLAFVYQLDKKRSLKQQYELDNLPIPEELRHD